MPMSGTEKRLAYQGRYAQLILLIDHIQREFKEFVAPKLTAEEIEEFFKHFDENENNLMDWIEENKAYYIKKAEEQKKKRRMRTNE